jgi:biopolymer transport protein TolQ
VYAAAVQATNDQSIVRLILEADIIVQLVLAVLVLMSVACWAIIFQKAARVRSASRQSARFLDLFWASKRLDEVYEKTGSFRRSPVAEARSS